MPGVRSTKKFPSRNSRGRIFSVASACSGSPLSSRLIVTSATSVPRNSEMPWTVPTLTPATRTGEFFVMFTAEAKTAFSWKPWWKGFLFVNAA